MKTKAALLVAALLAAPALRAQRIVETPTLTNSPYGIVMDAQHRAWTSFTGGTLGADGGYYSVNLGAVSALTLGPDGAFWVCDTSGNKIWRFRPWDYLHPTGFTIPTANASPLSITTGPDGNLWFTENATNKIGRLTPAGTFTEFTIPTANSQPMRIYAAVDGFLYFTEYQGNKIGQITTAGAILEQTLPNAGSHPFGITGRDGWIFFTESGGNRIGYFFTCCFGNGVTELPIPTPLSTPADIAYGPDGAFYFTEYLANKIGRYTYDDEPIVEFPIPTPDSHPLGIVAGHGNEILFTELAGNKIGRLRLQIPGDVNADGSVTVADVFYLINFLFAGGGAPK